MALEDFAAPAAMLGTPVPGLPDLGVTRAPAPAQGLALDEKGAIPALLQPTVLIQDVMLDIAASSFDFVAIPQTYKHLQLVWQARGTTVAATTACTLLFNGDTGANYDYEVIFGNVNTPTAALSTADTNLDGFLIPAASATAGSAGAGDASIPYYAGTTFWKQILLREVAVKEGLAIFRGGNWRSTAAINRITVTVAAGNFAAGSRMTLYGVN